MQHSYEHRENARIEVSFPVKIDCAEHEQARAVAINIGKGGMLIDCASSTSFSKLDDVSVQLPIKHNKNNYIIAAKITRIQGNRIGLFFYSDPSEYLTEVIS